MINNSGMSREGWFREQSEEDWNAVIDTNLTGVWRVGKHATNAMIEAKAKGSIVNIASITAHRTQLMTAAYCVSKAGVDHLTRHMALENARYGIRVNAISPGYFKTAINDEYLILKRVRRCASGSRSAGSENTGAGWGALAFGVRGGSYMTGSTLVVDGGHL